MKSIKDELVTFERPMFGKDELVTFERPMFGRKDRWVCVIGGIEFSGENKEELRNRAIKMLGDEIERLNKESSNGR